MPIPVIPILISLASVAVRYGPKVVKIVKQTKKAKSEGAKKTKADPKKAKEEIDIAIKNYKQKNPDKKTFDTQDVVKIIKAIEKANNVWGYSKYNIERVINKKLEKQFLSESDEADFIKKMEPHIGKEQAQTLAGLLRFDVERLKDEGYLQEYQDSLFKNVANYVAPLDSSAMRGEEVDVTIANATREQIIKNTENLQWDSLITSLLNKPNTQGFKNRSESLKAILLKTSIESELDRLSQLVIDGVADDGLSFEETKLKLADTKNIASDLLPTIYGGISESGAILQSFSKRDTFHADVLAEKGVDNKAYYETIIEFYDKYQGLTDVEQFAHAYKNSPTKSKSWVADSTHWDRPNNQYVYSLLGNPNTLLKNIENNTFRMGMFFIEEPTAALVSKIRKQIPEANFINPSEEGGVEFIDWYIGNVAEILSYRMMAQNAADVWQTGVPIDPEQKILYSERNAFMSEEDIMAQDGPITGNNFYKYIHKNKNYFQQITGRALVTTDEAAKTIAFNRQLIIDAYKKAHIVLKETGEYDAAVDAFTNHITNYDARDIDYVWDVARTETFTQYRQPSNAVEKFIAKYTPSGDNPVLKYYVPIKRVLINQLDQGLGYIPGMGAFPESENPILNIPNVAQGIFSRTATDNYKRGGSARDRQIGKQVIGAMLLYEGYTQACNIDQNNQDFCITGTMPKDTRTMAAWKQLGLRPYSFHFRKGPDSKYKHLSYELIAPYNIPLALSANMGMVGNNYDPDYYDDWVDDTYSITQANATIIQPLVESGPYANLLDELFTDIAKFSSAENKFDAAAAWASKVTGQYGGNVLQMELSGGLANPGTLYFIEKSVNPEAKITVPADLQNDPNWVNWERSYKTYFQKWRSKTPGFSENLNDKLDWRGNSMLQNPDMTTRFIKGDYVDIFGMATGLYDADQEQDATFNYLIQNNVYPVIPNIGEASKIFGVRLDADEYHAFRNALVKEEISVLSQDGSTYIEDKVTFAEAMDRLVEDESFRNRINVSKFGIGKNNIIDNIRDQYIDVAKERTLFIHGGILDRDPKQTFKISDIMAE